MDEIQSFNKKQQQSLLEHIENGKITLSLRDQIIELIDSLNLTVDQKDALYIIEGYTKNKLWNTPWH